jgi:hypothetical protein
MLKKLLIKNIVLLFLFFSVQKISAQYKEYDIKAQYINLFTQYIEWPEESSVNDANLPFKICVIGDNPFGDIFKDLSKVAKIKDKVIEYKEVSVNSIEKCDILFISKSERGNLDKIVSSASGKGTLLISDSDGFAEKGVMINFFLENRKVHFEINISAAEKESIKISSRLLKLARIVK